MDADVLIVGGGPVGLSLALELGLQGRSCIVVERNDRVGLSPRAKTTNVRSREFMRRWGIADRLAAASPFGIDYPSDVVFATRMNGYELARFPNAFCCSPARDDRFAEHAQWVPQYRVESVLTSRVLENPATRLRLQTALQAFEVTEDGVVSSLCAPDGTTRGQVRTRFLVGADGAHSTVRQLLGIRMTGQSPLGHHHSVIFRSSALHTSHPLGRAVMYWLVNPEVPAVVSPLDEGGLWVFNCEKLSDGSDPALLLKAALGTGVDIEIFSRSSWTAHELIADSYSRGPVFLAGDACHLHPPFGGYGMNMGIGDAVDLGWKLAAVCEGWGGEALLDTYEIERRQFHQRVVDESVLNHAAISRRFVLDGIEDDGPAGETARARAGAQILDSKQREFDSLGMVLGNGYDSSPIIVPDGTPPAPMTPTHYTPSARPGSRLPHAWLSPGRGPGASLYDRLDPRGFTLVTTLPIPWAEQETLMAAARSMNIPLRVLDVAAAHLKPLFGTEHVLVRPDQMVAWRGSRLADFSCILATAAGLAGNQTNLPVNDRIAQPEAALDTRRHQ